MKLESSLLHSQEPGTSPYTELDQSCPCCICHSKQSVHISASVKHFVICKFLQCRVVSTLPNPQVGGPCLVGCWQLLIQYIDSHPPYLEASSSNCNLRTCYATVTGTHLSWVDFVLTIINIYVSLHLT